MSGTRKYELKQRAARLEETRRRIVEETVRLHLEAGPAETRISEIARRAGVQRATVYSHFPDDASLFAACSAHWRELHPAPDPAAWAAIGDPGERLRAALGALYGWFRETETMTAHVLRDAERLPALRGVVEPGLGAYLEAVRGLLAAPFGARGRRGERLDAALRAATDFHLWRALAPLGDGEAAELAAALVERAAA
ncbi:MAG TPA: TetR/AcrR family transcriptional regulator [Gaiellaceae bacterium]|nr:TetR/AcrR family transcriptional regulator [Gaiellaceae bacterium]